MSAEWIDPLAPMCACGHTVASHTAEDGCFACAGPPCDPWNGPECIMCRGTGEDFTYSGDPMRESPRNVPTGLKCRACNGHGREPL